MTRSALRQLPSEFVHHTGAFLAGAGFPVFLIGTLGISSLSMLLMLAIPPEATPFEQFAQDFRIWCFGYDPEAGTVEWGYVVQMVLSPWLMSAVTALIWWPQLRASFASGVARALRPMAGSVSLVLLAMAGIAVVGSAEAKPLAFRSADLRTQIPAPALALTNHRGDHVDLAALRGRVVVVTAVYASCGTACPMIMAQSKRVLRQLTERERGDVTLLGITLDPEHDTPERLAGMAAIQGVAPPLVHLLTGDPREVNRVLDALNVSRKRDPKTGIIDHASVFYVIDRRGRIAYRFAVGDTQEPWLVQAIRELVRET